MSRFPFVLLIFSILPPAFPQDASSANSEREKDVYAIYSSMLTNPRTSHGPDNNERYLIAPTTMPGVPPIPSDRRKIVREISLRYSQTTITERPHSNPSKRCSRFRSRTCY